MTNAINFNALSLSQLKEKAIALNAKVEGDKRLRSTWVKACELATSAIESATEAVTESLSEFTGCDLAEHAQVFSSAVVESYEIAHQQFVVPTEKAIAFTWNTATSDKAMRFYIRCAIVLMKFCFACYKAGMLARDWYEAVKDEVDTGEVDLYEVAASQVERVRGEVEKRIWHYDAKYQKALEQVKSEARSFFSLGEWVMWLMV